MTRRSFFVAAALLAASGRAFGSERRPPAPAEGFPFVLCRRDRGNFSGNGDWWNWQGGGQALTALSQAPHPDFVLVRRDRVVFLTTDAAVVQAVLAALAPVEALERRQDALGRQQAALGRRQADLGAEQVRATRPERQADLGRQQADLGRQQAALGRLQVDAVDGAAAQLAPVFAAAFAQGKMRPAADGLEYPPATGK